jgi:predicted MPP superfamily phosphohydrolase
MTAAARFAVFLTVVLAVWLLQHLYVGWRLWSLPVFAAVTERRALLAFLVAAFLTYPLGRILFGIGWHGVGRTLEYLGAVWMGTLLLLSVSLFVADVVTLGGFALRPWVDGVRTAAVAVALVAAAVAWVGGFRSPRIVELEATMPGLPDAADRTTIAHISDVHLGTILGRRRLAMIIDRVDALTPDLVAVTGDLVDGDAGVVEEMLPQLSTLTAPRGVYAVLGNHEYYAGRARSRKLLRDAGFVVLDNAAVEVVPGLWVAGVPDARGGQQTGGSEADLGRALAGVGGSAVVLLQHSPEHEQAVADAGVGLMLDGHTHGGQIWPFSIPVKWVYPHIAGTYKVGEMTQVVSRGAGQWGPPMRLFAPAEIIHITLRSPESARGSR